MKTIVTNSPTEAARFIREGGIVAFPTETVYGLGADAFNEAAVARIFEAKKRPSDNPLIAHVGRADQIGSLVDSVPKHAALFIDRFFPGPLTLVMPKAAGVPLIATAGLDTIGVRMPGEKITREFLEACGTPVVAPSANVSGRPSPTDWQSVVEDLGGRIDCVLKGKASRVGLESTVVDCTGGAPVVLRPGAVSIEELRSVVPETGSHGGDEESARMSPGMRHRHYSPKARVEIIGPPQVRQPSGCREGETAEADFRPAEADRTRGTAEADLANSAFIGFGPAPEGVYLVKIVESTEEYAREVFGFFRECDRRGIGLILCETVPEEGIGAALMDRLRRAAE